jgi:hypothetical protein
LLFAPKLEVKTTPGTSSFFLILGAKNDTAMAVLKIVMSKNITKAKRMSQGNIAENKRRK